MLLQVGVAWLMSDVVRTVLSRLRCLLMAAAVEAPI